MFYVYVLRSMGGSAAFYIGYSSDLRKRVADRNSGRNPSTTGRDWELLCYEAYQTKTAAVARERILQHDGRSRRALMERILRHCE